MHNCVPKTTRSKTENKEQNKCYRCTERANNTENEQGRNQVQNKERKSQANQTVQRQKTKASLQSKGVS